MIRRRIDVPRVAYAAGCWIERWSVAFSLTLFAWIALRAAQAWWAGRL